MKTPLYVGQVDENGLHLIERLPDDADEARKIVEQMNTDMGTDYKLIGEVPEEKPIKLGVGSIEFEALGNRYTGVVDRFTQTNERGAFPTMEVTLKGYPKL